MAETADVAVVGAGIMGCATAYELAGRGLKVIVLERGAAGAEQSSRAWGFVRQQGRHPAEVPLAAAANRIWRGLEAELGADLEWTPAGILVTGETEADAARLEEAGRVARDHGLESRLLGADEIAALVPGAPAQWTRGLYTAEDGHAEPAKAAAAFAAAARARGVVIRERTPVRAILAQGGRVAGVATAAGEVRAGAVVLAAGIGAADLARGVGVDLPIQPVRAVVAETAPVDLGTRVAVWSPGVAFRPRRAGGLVVGNGYRGIDAEHDLTLGSLRHLGLFLPTFAANWRILRLSLGAEAVADLARRLRGDGPFAALPEPRVTRRLVRRNLDGLRAAFPRLKGLGLARAWAGRIDATPDLIPIIDFPDDPAGLVVAAGFNGHGFALAPAVGRLLAERIATGRTALDLGAFRLARFRDGTARQDKGAL